MLCEQAYLETSNNLHGPHIPNDDTSIGGAGYHDMIFVLQAEHATTVALEGADALVCGQIPDLDGAVATASDELMLIVLDAVDAVLMTHQDVGGNLAEGPPPLELVFLSEEVAPVDAVIVVGDNAQFAG